MSLSHIDFWDVGQGDCSVLNFDDQSVVLIDTGGKKSPVVGWLADNPHLTIEAIVLTHIDADHAGALTPILEANKARIKAVYFFDFDRDDEKFKRLLRCVVTARLTSSFIFNRPEAGDVLWDCVSDNLRLEVLYPNYSEQLAAKSENSASALIGLFHDQKIVIAWPGDLTVARISDKLAAAELELLVGPHHGAPEDCRRQQKENPITFDPKVTFISVGSINQPGHPRPIYLKALAKKGCTVLCSELTSKCDPGFVSGRKPIVQGSGLLGLPANHSGVPCRGTFRLLFHEGRFVPDEYHTRHQVEIRKLPQPLCLRCE